MDYPDSASIFITFILGTVDLNYRTKLFFKNITELFLFFTVFT